MLFVLFVVRFCRNRVTISLKVSSRGKEHDVLKEKTAVKRVQNISEGQKEFIKHLLQRCLGAVRNWIRCGELQAFVHSMLKTSFYFAIL